MKKIIIAILIILCMTSICEATTLSDVRTRVRELLYETDEVNTIYSNTLLNEAINEGQYMLLDILPSSANYNMKTTSSITLVSGTSAYSLPTDFRTIISSSANGKPIIQLREEEFFGKYVNATTKDPMFCIFNNKINVYPNTLTGTLEIMYMKQPTFMTADTNSITLLSEFDRLIALAATIYVLRIDGQTVRSEAIARQFLDEVAMKAGVYLNTNSVNKKQGAAQ